MLDLFIALILIVILSAFAKTRDTTTTDEKSPPYKTNDNNDNHLKHLLASSQSETAEEGSKMNKEDASSTNATKATSTDGHQPSFPRSNFPSAEVVTFVNTNTRICGAIFKNPSNKCTHFYRYRLKGKTAHT